MSVSRTNRVSRCRLVHAGPDGAHHALVAQLDQGGHRLGRGLLPVVVGVVQVDDVHPVQAGALQAGLERAEHPVPAEVPDPPVVGGDVEPLRVAPVRVLRRRYEQPPDLRRDHVLVARPGPQGRAEPPFGEPEPVVRRGVEVADARRPGGVDGGGELLVGGGPVEVAALRRAEAQLGEAHRRPARQRSRSRRLQSVHPPGGVAARSPPGRRGRAGPAVPPGCRPSAGRSWRAGRPASPSRTSAGPDRTRRGRAPRPVAGPPGSRTSGPPR